MPVTCSASRSETAIKGDKKQKRETKKQKRQKTKNKRRFECRSEPVSTKFRPNRLNALPTLHNQPIAIISPTRTFEHRSYVQQCPNITFGTQMKHRASFEAFNVRTSARARCVCRALRICGPSLRGLYVIRSRPFSLISRCIHSISATTRTTRRSKRPARSLSAKSRCRCEPRSIVHTPRTFEPRTFEPRTFEP